MKTPVRAVGEGIDEQIKSQLTAGYDNLKTVGVRPRGF